MYSRSSLSALGGTARVQDGVAASYMEANFVLLVHEGFNVGTSCRYICQLTTCIAE